MHNFLRKEIIGETDKFKGPYGKRFITYADYTASGRGVRFIERYMEKLLVSYGNTHTENSYVGRETSMLYKEAKDKIRKEVNARAEDIIISTGNGSTGAINHLMKLLGLTRNYNYNQALKKFIEKRSDHQNLMDTLDTFENTYKPVVFISAYEHHSNELPFREGFADIVKINLTADGRFDLEDLEHKVSLPQYAHRQKIGSFSAASNVTGILSPCYEIAKIMHEAEGLVFFDFASAGPYIEINMQKDEHCYFDGIYLSMHKFLGGPGACGLLIINGSIYNDKQPPIILGGGIVDYVTHDDYKFIISPEGREEAGTPGILQMIKASLALELKALVKTELIEETENYYCQLAYNKLSQIENLDLYGPKSSENRLPIFSFNIKHRDGYLHPGFICTLLSDLFGIQARAGCSCAGPYGIQLLEFDDSEVTLYKEAINAQINIMKPGWVRISLHYAMPEETVNYILEAIEFIATKGHTFLADYEASCVTGEWRHISFESERNDLNLVDAIFTAYMPVLKKRIKALPKAKTYHQYIRRAKELSKNKGKIRTELYAKESLPKIAWFYTAKL